MGKVRKEKKSGGFWYFVRNLNKKHRLSIRDQHNDTEVSYMYISTWRVAFAFLGLFIILSAGVIALVVYTPVLDRLPVNPGQRSRDMLAKSIMKLDSLENELKVMMLYGENVRLIMEGKTPVIRTMKNPQTEAGENEGITTPSEADSLLRRQLESLDGRYALVHDGGQSASGARRMEFIAPVAGRVTAPFNPSAGMNGVRVALAKPGQIAAAAPGTVVMSIWTPEDDHIIEIQHRNNYITIYKGIPQLLKSTGDRVEAGEAIGYTLADTQDAGAGAFGAESANTAAATNTVGVELPARQLVFELWSDGQPIDPQRYIVF